ncbi:MAG TPA: DUF6328 family protein, partial [Actinomycetes bacterium]|nr:DUF6328 family protein [Actinomycetes bacterium]
DPETDESPKERLDRELIELLQGLRVALPGVQVLFAFLLTVPFATGFDRVTDDQKRLLVFALAAAAVASICLISPAAQHRILFRTGQKEILVRRSNVYGIVGTIALGLAMAASLLLIVDVVIGLSAAYWMAALLTLLWAWTWFGQPLLTRMRAKGSGS